MAQTTRVTHDNPEWILMAKALRGELSEEEQLEFSAWLNHNEAHPQQWAEAVAVWEEVGFAQNQQYQPDANAAWETLTTKLGISGSKAPMPEETKVIPIFQFKKVYQYAAVFILAVGLAWIGYLQYNNTSSAWTQVATVTGERKVIFLPDSSQVTLNGNSILRYQTAFSGNERKVELTGEAFFHVRRNPKKPFLITTRDARTKVLGTSFNVRALPTEKEVSVEVLTGKVSFASLKKGKKVILTPGLVGVLQADGQLLKEHVKNTGADWRTLTFQSASLQEVAQQLEKYFSVTIRMNDTQLQACTFTGTFETPQLKEILTVLAASNDVKVVQTKNDTYSITGPGCQ